MGGLQRCRNEAIEEQGGWRGRSRHVRTRTKIEVDTRNWKKAINGKRTGSASWG